MGFAGGKGEDLPSEWLVGRGLQYGEIYAHLLSVQKYQIVVNLCKEISHA